MFPNDRSIPGTARAADIIMRRIQLVLLCRIALAIIKIVVREKETIRKERSGAVIFKSGLIHSYP
jgi:hypothetical protein